MDEPFIPHTSAFACDDIARETVAKTYGDKNVRSAAARISHSVIIPLCSQIITGGKVRQGELRRVVSGLERTLRNEPTIVSVVAKYHRPSAVSTKENARLTYVLAMGDEENREWINFVTSEVVMTRTTFDLSHTLMDFRIHSHALSRFMQRERKPAEQIMREMLGAMEMASLFGNTAIAFTDTPHCAVLIGDAMLFGNVGVLLNEKETKAVMHRFHAERKAEPREWEEDRRPHLIKAGRAHVEAITYVGDKQLTPNREKLRDTLRSFRTRHSAALSNLFERHYYKYSFTHPMGTEALDVAVKAATDEAAEIVKGREWQAYVRGVGTGPHG